MNHPLHFIPSANRKPILLALLIWTIIMVGIMQTVSAPLKTSAAPMGIVSFELAGTPEKAFQIMVSWELPQKNGESLIASITPTLYAAFGLGLDYLFMPSYALALALGVLLALGRHKGWFASLGIWVGWGSLAAALFDAAENFALWKILLGDYQSAWPMIAAVCATIKFALIVIGLVYAVFGGVRPGSEKEAEIASA